MNIVYVSDDDYAFLAGVSILSLLRSNQDAESITIHFFDDGVGEANREKLTRTVHDYKREIVFYDIRKEIQRLTSSVNAMGIYSPNGGVKETYTVYGRICIGEILPQEITRALYVDCDTFIDGSLQPLFDGEVGGGHCVSMVLDCSRPEYRQFIGLSGDDFYFNSGVILFDLEKWRAEKCAEKVLKYMQSDTRSYPFADQDFLNHALKGNIGLLPCRYNFASSYFLYSYAGTKFVYGFDRANRFYGKDEFNAAQRQSVIYHFCGHAFTRPFYRNSCHPIKKKYDLVYFESRWRDRPQVDHPVAFHDRVRNFLYRFTPKCFAALVGYFAMRWAMRAWHV